MYYIAFVYCLFLTAMTMLKKEKDTLILEVSD